MAGRLGVGGRRRRREATHMAGGVVAMFDVVEAGTRR